MFNRTRKRVQTRTSGASLTEQKWAERQDVNAIVAKCLRGDNSGLITCGFQFADVSEMPDNLHALLNQKVECDALWDSMPVAAKERWKTPADMLAAISDERERPFFKQFGMLKDEEAAPPPTPPAAAIPPAAGTPPSEPVTPNGAA